MEKLEHAVKKTFDSTLSAKLENFIGDVEDVETLRTTIRQNVAAGELRFVVLMDYIEDKLRNLLTFVNRNSQFTIYGVEMEFYKFDKYEILIPKLYGAEVTKESPKTPTLGRDWDEKSFFEAVENRDKSKVKPIRELYELSKPVSDKVVFRSPSKAGAIDVYLNNISPDPLYTVFSKGHLILNFNWLPSDNENSASIAPRFCEAVKHLPGFELSTDFLSRRERQKIEFEQWSQSITGFAQAIRTIREVPQSDVL